MCCLAYLAPSSTLFGQCHSLEMLSAANQDSFKSSLRAFAPFFLPKVSQFCLKSGSSYIHKLLSLSTCRIPQFSIAAVLYWWFVCFQNLLDFHWIHSSVIQTSQFHWMQHNTKAWWGTVGQLFYTWNSLPFLLQAGLGERPTLLSCTIPPALEQGWKQALVLTGKLRSDTSVKATVPVITLLIISCYWTDIFVTNWILVIICSNVHYYQDN